MRVLLVIFVLLTSGLPAVAQPVQPGLHWKVDHSPFRLQFFDKGRPLIGQAAGRMSYTLADGSTHSLTNIVRTEGSTYVVATDEAARTAQVSVQRTPRGVRVEWRLTPASDVVQVHETLTGDDAEHFLGGGANFIYTDLRHRVLLNKAFFTGASTLGRCNKSGMPSPFFLSSRGYAVFPETDAIGRIAFPNAVDDPPHCSSTPPPCPVELGQPDRTQLCFKTNKLDYEIYSGGPSQVVSAYSARAGLPKLPPVRQFALTHWRDTVADQATVVDDVNQLLDRGIPLATEWIDNPWEISTKLPGRARTAGTPATGR
ncbi:hypothetical protein [Kibdelosporangium philippinense]|uniref:hypothetical protein n=1 Tax=Kibdelosporangium philippinense TaxID=211113 RepID=UPI0036245538